MADVDWVDSYVDARLPMTEAQRNALIALQKQKKASIAFNAVASAVFTATAATIFTLSTAFANSVRAAQEPPVAPIEGFSIGIGFTLTVLASIVPSMVFFAFSADPGQKIREKAQDAYDSFRLFYHLALNEKLEKAKEEFLENIRKKDAADLTDDEYNILALMNDSDDLPEDLLYKDMEKAKAKTGRTAFSTILVKRPLPIDIDRNPETYGRDFAFPAIATFSLPLLYLASALKAKVPDPETFSVPEPEMPDLAKIAREAVAAKTPQP